MSGYVDKHGEPIKAGDILYNDWDALGYYEVLEKDGELFLGDLDSPLRLYKPQDYWEIRTIGKAGARV